MANFDSVKANIDVRANAYSEAFANIRATAYTASDKSSAVTKALDGGAAFLPSLDLTGVVTVMRNKDGQVSEINNDGFIQTPVYAAGDHSSNPELIELDVVTSDGIHVEYVKDGSSWKGYEGTNTSPFGPNPSEQDGWIAKKYLNYDSIEIDQSTGDLVRRVPGFNSEWTYKDNANGTMQQVTDDKLSWVFANQNLRIDSYLCTSPIAPGGRQLIVQTIGPHDNFDSHQYSDALFDRTGKLVSANLDDFRVSFEDGKWNVPAGTQFNKDGTPVGVILKPGYLGFLQPDGQSIVLDARESTGRVTGWDGTVVSIPQIS